MRTSSPTAAARAAWLLCCSALAAHAAGGCARPTTHDRYVPRRESARSALDAVLRAWQSGAPAEPIENRAPRIEVVDTQRKPGQQLRAYEILGEVPGDGRCFSVRLELTSPDEQHTVRYIVVGIDPLYVFRDADYAQIAHWENPKEDEPTAGDESVR